jgi:putative transcriptional regulator
MLCWLCLGIASTSHADSDDDGIFLVATEQLHGTPFQEAVILITHNSERGATGLTINRPSDIPLREVFPHQPRFATQNDLLYLGGPVSTNAIFVLTRTTQPERGMHRIANDVYFATGKIALRRAITGPARTYAGYAGWAPNQLQREIDNGDWLVVHTNPAIVFDSEPAALWARMMKHWSGRWI